MLSHEHGDGKIQGWHRDRLAAVYVRQSSRQQVADHSESTRLQYGLTERAAALGCRCCRRWPWPHSSCRSPPPGRSRPARLRWTGSGGSGWNARTSPATGHGASTSWPSRRTGWWPVSSSATGRPRWPSGRTWARSTSGTSGPARPGSRPPSWPRSAPWPATSGAVGRADDHHHHHHRGPQAADPRRHRVRPGHRRRRHRAGARNQADDDIDDGEFAEEFAGLLIRRGDVGELRARADAGDYLAAKGLANLLTDQDDVDGLRDLVDAGIKQRIRPWSSASPGGVCLKKRWCFAGSASTQMGRSPVRDPACATGPGCVRSTGSEVVA